MTIVFIVFCKKHLKNRFLHNYQLILKAFAEILLAKIPSCAVRRAHASEITLVQKTFWIVQASRMPSSTLPAHNCSGVGIMVEIRYPTYILPRCSARLRHNLHYTYF